MILRQRHRPISPIRTFGLCRVKFDTQQAGNGEEIPLVKAAKTIFDTSDPSFWSLCALVSPLPLLPVIRLLARMFPGKHMQTSQKAFETLYDASNALIEVRHPAYRACIAVRQLLSDVPLHVACSPQPVLCLDYSIAEVILQYSTGCCS